MSGYSSAVSTVGHAMITIPKTCPATTTVGAARALLGDHVHALLVVAGRRLLAVVERDDLAGAPDDAPIRPLGRLAGRTVPPGADLAAVREAMERSGVRRLAVVDADGDLVGLLCRKRSGRGFCTDEGVLARWAERA